MNIFYIPKIKGNSIVLDEAESKHCVRVLRLSKGDEITLVDGRGGLYVAQIINPDSRHCEIEITSCQVEVGKRNYHIHIAIAPTKNIERFEWFIEKATEIGIDEITPVLCFHSERKILKTERLEKILVSAMKQSLKAYLPKLNQMSDYNSFINNSVPGQKFIAHCYTGEKGILQNEVISNKDVTVLIGPEGDFSEEEVKNAMEKGFREISLGKSRLRTETAGIVACHTVNLVNEKNEQNF
ncbi:MAG: 16S rRNA (uracil(1498)-N(3))-methyltransferase [Prolixibacteraceae bacterium]|nr:16S rRNA (uracil(1498)-N(3))-methyltransferase [Prolixibacteraceae bacterium]